MNFSLVSFVQMEFHCLPISIIQTIYKEDYRNSRIVKHSLYKYMYILSIERFFETKIAIISNNLLTLDRTMIINIKKYRLFPIITLAKKKKKNIPSNWFNDNKGLGRNLFSSLIVSSTIRRGGIAWLANDSASESINTRPNPSEFMSRFFRFGKTLATFSPAARTVDEVRSKPGN